MLSTHTCVCPNLVPKVQPFLWTPSNVVRFPGGLHHRHGLSLANIAMEITALMVRPLACNTPEEHQHACNHAHVSVCFSVFTCRRGHGDTQPVFPWGGAPLCPVLKHDLRLVAPPVNKQDVERSSGCFHGISGSTSGCLINSTTDRPDLLSGLPNRQADPPVGWAQ